MKVKILNINSDILIGKSDNSILEYVARNLTQNGAIVNNIDIISNSTFEIEKALKNDQLDMLVIIGEDNANKNFVIKNAFCNFYKINLTKSAAIENSLNIYCNNNNVPLDINCKNEFFIPENSNALIASNHKLNGFIYINRIPIIFLPGNLDCITEIFNTRLINILDNFSKNHYESFTIKTFGISERDVLSILKDYMSNKHKIIITTYAEDLEIAIVIRYNKLIEQSIIDEFIQIICKKLKKYIYATTDISLFELAGQLLELSKKTLSICETITKGNITNNMLGLKNINTSYINQGLIYNNENIKRKSLNIAMTNTFDKISVESAYQMANNILEQSKTNLVLVTCGEISENGNSCFIAVGDSDGIHVYKNNYSGSRDRIISSISKCAIFYLIKKIKQNDLYFNQFVV